jgi:hypothetical protein
MVAATDIDVASALPYCVAIGVYGIMIADGHLIINLTIGATCRSQMIS